MSDGVTPKLVDLVDCTGAGDIDVSHEVDAFWNDGGGGEDGTGQPCCWEVKGLSGRTLKLNPNWKMEPKFPVPIDAKEGGGEGNVGEKGEEKSEEKGAGEGDQQEQGGAPSEAAATGQKVDKKTVKVRLGMKRAYDLFPSSLVSRMKSERSKVFKKEIEAHVADVHRDLADLKARIGDKSSPTPLQAKERDDLEAKLEGENSAR